MVYVYRWLFTSCLLLLFAACHSNNGQLNANATTKTDTSWVASWTTAPQLVEPHNNPPDPGLSNNTLHQIFKVSIGGERVRMKFSNEFSNAPLNIQQVTLAQSHPLNLIDSASSKQLTFNSKKQITLNAGEALYSDPVNFQLAPLSTLAVTIRFGDTPADVTGHPGSRTTSYLLQNTTSDLNLDLDRAIKTDHWYIISSLEVDTSKSAQAVVVLGDSISDGRGSGTNKQNRWPDILSQRLQADARTRHIAVLNQGIGGNCVLKQCLGPAAIDRFERDVLKQPGVKWLIILEGINDIGSHGGDEVAQGLINSYKHFIALAHANDIQVYGGTLLPFAGADYDTPASEKARTTVNTWIRNSGAFDAVIDFEKALASPDNPLQMQTQADTGDHLHPNETGHRLMGEAVALSLFGGE